MTCQLKIARAGARRWPALGVLGLCMLVLNLDTTIVNVALATLARDLHADTGQLQWITTAYLLTGAALMLLAGAIGDRVGRKRTLLGGLVVFALASVLGAWAPSAGVLIAARALMGVGSAVVMPMSLSIIPVLFPDEVERGKAIALWSATVVLGMPLGPIIGGALLGSFWWGSIFLINVAVIAVALPLGSWLLPESRSSRPGRIDAAGIALSVVGCAALVDGFIDAGGGWGRLPVLAWLAAGLALLAAFAVRQRTVSNPLIPLQVFRRAAFSAPMAAMVLMLLAMSGVLFVIPLYLQGVRGLDALATGLLLVPLALGALAASLASAGLVKVLGPKLIMTVGMTAVAAGLALLATLRAGSGDLIVCVGMALVGAGVGLAQPPAMNAAIGAFPADRVGSASGLINAIRQLASVFGVAVIGAAVASIYTARLAGRLAALSVPQGQQVTANVANVAAVAARLGTGPADELRAAAFAAFTHGTGIVLACCAAVALLAIAAVAAIPGRSGPARGKSQEGGQ
jgi:EmrB/QacA subfamily drug resistance transporter